jgi:hypothetical protein
MSQFDWGTMDPYVVDGVQLADDLNQFRSAINSLHQGSGRPPYVVPGMLWINTAGGASAWVLSWYVSPTVGDVPLFTLNTTTGAITISASAGGQFAAAVLLAQAAASPQVQWNATGNGVDLKNWRMIVNGAGALVLSSYSDAGVLQQSITFNRDGTVTKAPNLGLVTAGNGSIIIGTNQPVVCGTIVSGNTGSWYNTTNGRYTPPAGRYFIQCTGILQAPSGGNGTWSLTPRKNGTPVSGVALSGSGSALFLVPITCGLYVDANGTDYFEFVANAAAGMASNGGMFTAFPVG